MKHRIYSSVIGIFLFASNAQSAQFICQTEDGQSEFFLETFSGSQNAKVFKSYWGDQLSSMYVLTSSKVENSKLIESYSLAHTIYSSGADKTFKLRYKNLDPNGKVFKVVHFGNAYLCE